MQQITFINILVFDFSEMHSILDPEFKVYSHIWGVFQENKAE